jgi:hypothetical protein
MAEHQRLLAEFEERGMSSDPESPSPIIAPVIAQMESRLPREFGE